MERAVTAAVTGAPGFLVSALVDWLVLIATLAAQRLRRRVPWLGAVPVGAVALALAGAAALADARPASASPLETSTLQDDDALIYASPLSAARALDEIAGLGVDQVRVSVDWVVLAPDPYSRRRPRFDASDPSAYPPGAWSRYDTIDRLAAARGLAVLFDLTGPAPRWATRGRAPTGIHQGAWRPSAAEFGLFAAAVGRRYDGSFAPGSGPAGPAPPSLLGIPIAPRAPAVSRPLPAVRTWELWNEPNDGGWLAPQSAPARDGRLVPQSPALYRELVDAGTQALAATGHGGDVILIGATASHGTRARCARCNLAPLVFVRTLYCLDATLRPLAGPPATAVGCPRRFAPRRFAAAHPGLFTAGGWSHHPYSLDAPPGRPAAAPDDAPLASLGRLERTLDAAVRPYHRPHPGGPIPLYLTEYGYRTNPPNPFVLFSPAQQAAFLNVGEYLAYRDRRVMTMGQFLLRDDHPRAGAAVGSLLYWSTFQTGLETVDGVPKPALAAYRLAAAIPDARPGRPVFVWSDARFARGAPTNLAVQFRAARGGPLGVFRTVGQLANTPPRGFATGLVTFPGPGTARLLAADPVTGLPVTSRPIPIG